MFDIVYKETKLTQRSETVKSEQTNFKDRLELIQITI